MSESTSCTNCLARKSNREPNLFVQPATYQIRLAPTFWAPLCTIHARSILDDYSSQGTHLQFRSIADEDLL